MNMINLTIIVILAYFLLMTVFGIFIKRAKSSEEFSTAKNNLGVLAVTSGLVMTMYGGGFVLGGSELAYKYGWFGLVYGFSAAAGIFLLGLILGGKISKERKVLKINTIPSLLYKKYNSKSLFYLSSILSIVSLTAIASAQLFASTKIFTALGIPVKTSLVITTLVVILVATKGMDALTKSGKYNLIIASLGALAAIFVVGNVNPAETVSSGFESFPLSSLLFIAIPTVLYSIIGQDLQQKLYSAKSKKVMKTGCFLAALILVLLSFFPVAIGVKSNALFVIDPAQAIPQFIIYSFPGILRGLFIAAILAAVIGCTQSVINAASTQVSEDIFKPLGIKKKFLRHVPSLSAVFLSLSALVITLFSTSIINNLIIAYLFYTAGMFVPVIGAFFLKNPGRYKKKIFSISLLGIFVAFLLEFGIVNAPIPSIVGGVLTSFLLFVLLGISNNVTKE
jgi:solute:Na+ symporter, SSS family